jgi:hypothetical protein
MTNLRLIATAAVCLTVGGAIGYKYAEKKLLNEFEERLERETNLVRRMYKPEHETPEDMVEALYGDSKTEATMDAALSRLKEYRGEGDKEPIAYHKIRPSTVKIGEKEEKVIERRVFEPTDDRGEIYIISAEENAEGSYQNVTWTYYAGDGVVTDIHEDRVEDYSNHIGTDFVNEFGGISGDDNVVYVRNEISLIDYEIVRSHGSYLEEVLEEEAPPPRPSQRFAPPGD